MKQRHYLDACLRGDSLIRFALLGCGRITSKHADPIFKGQVADAELAAVCDINKEAADRLAAKYNVPAFYSLDELLHQTKVQFDVVSVLTPSGLHPEHSIQALSKGKHVVVEKPMALRLEDGEEMIKTAKKHERMLFVVKQNRFNPAVQQLKTAIAEGRFGKISLATVRVRWCRPQDYYNQSPWRGTWALDGGVFSNQASHHVDLLQWLAGEVESVIARGSQAMAKIQAEDTGVVLVKFKNGALGVIEATTATRPFDLEGSVSILGEKGTVEIAGKAVNEVRHWQFIDANANDKTAATDSNTAPPDVYGFGHVHYLNNVVQTLLGKEKALVDGAEGFSCLKLLNAIYESMASGKEVFLSESFSQSKLGKR